MRLVQFVQFIQFQRILHNPHLKGEYPHVKGGTYSHEMGKSDANGLTQFLRMLNWGDAKHGNPYENIRFPSEFPHTEHSLTELAYNKRLLASSTALEIYSILINRHI